MNGAHLHLLINHLPIFGSFLAIPLFGLALWRRRDPMLLLAAMIVLAFAGGGAVGAYFTGEPAEEVVEDHAGVDKEWIEVHEERAERATILAVLTTIGGLGTLGWAWKKGEVPLAGASAVLGGTILTFGAMAWTGFAGGQIRHDEIRAEGPGLALEEHEADDRH
jgi:hypothetical protein